MPKGHYPTSQSVPIKPPITRTTMKNKGEKQRRKQTTKNRTTKKNSEIWENYEKFGKSQSNKKNRENQGNLRNDKKIIQ